MEDKVLAEIQKLNPQQREAVESLHGPVMVVAGPGTGKTQVLALRIANLLLKTDANPYNILCLTFTESGVIAMRNRLKRFIGSAAYQVKIHTFHSFCNEVIQNFPDKFEFSRELSQLDDINKIKIIREVINEIALSETLELIPYNNKYRYVPDILSLISNLKKEGVSPKDFEEKCKEILLEHENNKVIGKRTQKPTDKWQRKYTLIIKNLEVAKFYAKFQEKILEQGFYDYEDMINFVINKFETDETLLANYQEQLLYILVDEYQDTNGSQNKIIRLLGSFDKSPNIFAVGDDDQAIYRFQGANIENILFFEREFKDVKTLPILTNYRSSQLILDLSIGLIKNNSARLETYIETLNKQLKSGLDIPDYPAEIHEFLNSDEELNFLKNKIKELNDNGTQFKDIAILVRKNRDLAELDDFFATSGIPFNIFSGNNILENKYVVQFLNILKVINDRDREREKELFQLLFYKYFEIETSDSFKITRYAHDNKVSFMDIISDRAHLQKLSLKNVEKIENLFSNIIKWKSESFNQNFHKFCISVSKESGLLQYLYSNTNTEDQNTFTSFLNYIKQLNYNNKSVDIEEFLNDLKILEENKISINKDTSFAKQEGINILTAHKSKGLEFKHVFLYKFTNSNWGKGRNTSLKLVPEIFLDKDKELADVDEVEDERRLVFVAITRAKEKLYFTYAKEYRDGNNVSEAVPSQFIGELNEKLTQLHVHDKPIETNMIESILEQEIDESINLEIESEYLKSLIENFKLSPSALNCYLECPNRFKYEVLLKAPQVKSNDLVLGTAVHYALENFYKKILKKESYTIDEVLAYAKFSIEKELISDEDSKAIFVEASEVLTKYLDFYKSNFKIPIDTEYSLFNKNITIQNESGDVVSLSGKLDKVEILDTITKSLKITDYKTSKPKSQNEIKGLTKSSNGAIFRQLVFYKLLLENDKSFALKHQLPAVKVEEVEVDFLRESDYKKFKRETFNITQDDISTLKTTIFEVMKKIRNLDFDNKPEHAWCDDCEYCEMAQ